MRKKELPEDIRKAFEEIEELWKDPSMRAIALSREMGLRDYYQRLCEAEEGLYEAEQRGREEGRKQGRKQGIEEGYRSEKLRLAKNLKAQGFSNEQIKSLMELEMSEIEALE